MSAPGFRQSQAGLHTWSGLLVGWILYLIFLNGTVSYWRDEITRWARPEVGATHDVTRVLTGAVAFLQARAPDAESWTITLPSERQSGATVTWRDADSREQPRHDGASANSAFIGPDGRPTQVRDTEGGDVFYRLHFDLRYVPVLWGRWIVGFCTMFMLVAIVSGVITHRKIFADFFTFRPGKGQRSWMDGHNALAVLALPFHAMITYTGLITLMTLYVPWAVSANFESRGAFFQALSGGRTPAAEATGASAPLYPLEVLVRRAETDWGARAGTVRVEQPNDAAARVVVVRHAEASLIDGAVERRFDGVSGAALPTATQASPATVARGGMIGLHAGRFSPLALRWLFFLSGVAGTAMVATGLVLWTAKRRGRLADPARPHLGFVIVERLNVGTIAGLPLAMTGFLWANRLLPQGLAERAAWEAHVLFLVWGAALLAAFVLPPRRTWPALFALTGAALVALPVHDLFATSRGLVDSVLDGDLAMAGMQLGLLAAGGLFVGLGAFVNARLSAKAPVARRRAALAESAS